MNVKPPEFNITTSKNPNYVKLEIY